MDEKPSLIFVPGGTNDKKNNNAKTMFTQRDYNLLFFMFEDLLHAKASGEIEDYEKFSSQYIKEIKELLDI